MTEGTGNNAGNTPPADAGQGGTPPAGAGQGAQPQLTTEAVLEYLNKNPEITAKLVQPAVDSAISKHVQEKNQYKQKLEEIELSGKTDLEKTNYQLEKERNARLALEKEINGVKLNAFKNEIIVDYGLNKDDMPFLTGESVEDIKQKAEVLKNRYASIQEQAKKELLKNASGVPNSGGNAPAQNPFNDDSWNPSAQLELNRTNPKVYAELRAAAKANPNNSKIKL